MSDKKDINITGEDTTIGGSTNTEKDSYYDAKAAQYKGRYQPSKLHELDLVAYIEKKDGSLKPVYREEQ